MMGLVRGGWRPSVHPEHEETVVVFQLDRLGVYAVFHAPPNGNGSWPEAEGVMFSALRPIWGGEDASLWTWIQAANRNATESPACRNNWKVPEPCEEYASWRHMPPHLRIPVEYEFTDIGGFFGGDVRLITEDWLLSVNLGSWQLGDAQASLRITPNGHAFLEGIHGVEGESPASYGAKVDAWLSAQDLPASSDIKLRGPVC